MYIDVRRLFGIAIQVTIFVYILNLEKDKCICSRSWMRKFIKIMSVVMVSINLLLLLFEFNTDRSVALWLYTHTQGPPTVGDMKNKIIKYKHLIAILLGFIVFISLFYAITSIIYFVKLQKKLKCTCSKDWKRYALITPLIMACVALVFIILMNIYRFIKR